jgi:hypothetical protein
VAADKGAVNKIIQTKRNDIIRPMPLRP